jgi:hypothetical protein
MQQLKVSFRQALCTMSKLDWSLPLYYHKLFVATN